MPFQATRAPLNIGEQLDTFAGVAASELATILSDDLARGHRSGPIYSEFGSLYPASVYGEPEQEQTGALRRSVGTREEANQAGLINVFSFGFYNEDPAKLYQLEIDDESPTYRGWLERIATDRNAIDFATTQGVIALEE